MFSRKMLPVWIGIILLSGILLIDEDCLAQTDPCNPDPCGGIDYAAQDSCHNPVPAGFCNEADFTCDCLAGFTWKEDTNTCRSDMASIPGGCFDMGDHFNEGESNELPVHNVCISAFEMDLHEVTNAEYKACVDDGGCITPASSSSSTRSSYYGNASYDDFPVIYVSWYQATDYCTWAGKRLPTEAEWEYAARGGLSGQRYPWGDIITCADANYSRVNDQGECWSYAGSDNDTHPVGSYYPNGYAVYDMAGDVLEWVYDWYQSGYYTVSPTNDPQGPETGTYRVLRGGSWTHDAHDLRVATRYWDTPDRAVTSWGFRCARGGAYGP